MIKQMTIILRFFSSSRLKKVELNGPGQVPQSACRFSGVAVLIYLFFFFSISFLLEGFVHCGIKPLTCRLLKIIITGVMKRSRALWCRALLKSSYRNSSWNFVQHHRKYERAQATIHVVPECLKKWLFDWGNSHVCPLTSEKQLCNLEIILVHELPTRLDVDVTYYRSPRTLWEKSSEQRSLEESSLCCRKMMKSSLDFSFVLFYITWASQQQWHLINKSFSLFVKFAFTYHTFTSSKDKRVVLLFRVLRL